MSTQAAEHAETPHDAILAGLTDEERAALAAPDEDDDAPAATATTAEGAKPDDTTPTDKGGQPDAAAAAANALDSAVAAGGDAAPAAADQAASTAEPSPAPQQAAPILVAQAPEDAENKLAEIATAKSTLDTKFDEGDITNAEYRKELDALNKRERDIELDLREAKLAEKMESQRQQNEWNRDCNSFLANHAEYQGEANKEAFARLNETVMVVARLHPSLTGPQVLEKAHKFMQVDGGAAPAPAAKAAATAKPAQAVIPKQAAQPSLHAVPAAQVADAGEGRFAALRNLNGFQLEDALSKMSEAERAAFMAESD